MQPVNTPGLLVPDNLILKSNTSHQVNSYLKPTTQKNNTGNLVLMKGKTSQTMRRFKLKSSSSNQSICKNRDLVYKGDICERKHQSVNIFKEGTVKGYRCSPEEDGCDSWGSGLGTCPDHHDS